MLLDEYSIKHHCFNYRVLWCGHDGEDGMGRDEEKVNQTQLIGRLTKDPELRYSPTGVPTVRFILAVNREFTNQQGEREADFISCVAFRKLAENLANFQKKGNRIGVVGRIQTGSYEGQDGKRVYTTDVIASNIEFLDYRSENAESPNSAPSYQGNTNYQSSNQNANTQSYGQNQTYSNSNYQDPFANGNGPVVSEDDLPFDLTSEKGGVMFV